MKIHLKKLKRYAALWLSIAMLAGSVYINEDTSSLATEAIEKLADKTNVVDSENNNEAESFDTVKTVKATASDSPDEVEDGEVIDDTASSSDAVIDGEVIDDGATDSDAILDGDIATIANALLSLATSSDVVNPNAASFLRLDSSITGSIATPSDFAIGKAGTKTMKIAYLFDFQDIAEGDRNSIGAEIVIPKGFDVDESTIETDSNWTTTVTTNEDGDNLIIFKNIGNLTTLRQTLVIVQDAQYLINHLSERHIYKFQSKFYNNYGNENQALVVKNEGDEETDSFTFEADNTTPTWTVDPVCNNETWKPVDIFGTNYKVDKINRHNNSAREDFTTGILSKDNSSCASFCYDNKYLIVKFKKTLGYIADDTIFKFMTETLPIYTYKGKQYYGIIVNYTDIYGNTIHIYNDTISNNTEKLNSFQVFDGIYSLQAANISNQYTGDNIKQFTTHNENTICDILYHEGTFEIKVMPYLYCNKLFYENNWIDDKIVFTSSNATAVVAKNNETSGETTYENEPIKVEIVNGTWEQGVSVVNTLSAENLRLLQYGTTDTYNDILKQSIRLDLTSGSGYLDWKVYDNFCYTIEYKEASGKYEEALYPIKLTGLMTSTDYGFTYKVHIKDLTTNSERVVTILGLKNQKQAYDYTPAANETIIGTGLTTWDGTTGEYKLSETEYVTQIEILKQKLVANKFRYSSYNIYGTATLRAQHTKIDGSERDIPSETSINIVSTIKMDDHILKEHIQTATTIHGQDNLELIKTDSDISIQINKAKRDTGVLGMYTLKKYPDTTTYDKNDPPIVVLSGDGITLTDRVAATNQRLMYVVDPDGNVIDVTDAGNIKANDYIINSTNSYWEIYAYGYDKEHIISRYRAGNVNINAYRSNSRWLSNSDNDTQLYNLTALYKALGIDYAKELIISQDYVNDWLVTSDSGETWVKYFYANQIKPHYLNYDALVPITKENIEAEAKTLTYSSELYCKASDWLNKKATDSNAGSHGKDTAKTQNISRIVYGGKDTLAVGEYAYSFVTPIYNNNPNSIIDNDGSNVLAKVYASFNEDINNIYMDYDNVEYDFSKTDPQLLSITSGIGMYCNDNGEYQLDIEYTTSDGKTHKYEKKRLYGFNLGRGGYKYMPFAIDEGTYVTGIKVRPSSDDFIWSKISDGGAMQSSLPQITLCMSDNNGIMPSKYPSSGRKIGYQGNIDEASGRIYDQLPVKCTISYDDTFGNHTSETVEGLSTRISKSILKLQYAETVLSNNDSTNNRVEYLKSSVNTGGIINVKVCPGVFISSNITIDGLLKLKPIFYYAIYKDFTPDAANINGIPDGASTVFYPPGTGNGHSGNDDYGYLVIDLGNVDDENLSAITSKKMIALKNLSTDSAKYRYGWLYGPYTIPLMTSYEAREGDRIPIPHMWTDVPHDSGRDGGTGNALADIDLLDSACTAGAPDIIDSTGTKISNVKTNSSGSPIMLYADLTSATGAQIAVNSRAVSGIVPYVTESATDGFSQDAVTSRDYTELDKTKGLFGNKIYAVGDATNTTTDFDIYVPVAKKGESNLADGNVQSEKSDYSLDFVDIDISELKNAENAEGAVVYFTTTPNPGSGGFTTMKAASWTTTTPSDASKITGIKVHMDKLMPGTTVPFYISYKLHEDKSSAGTQTAYQTFYGDYKLNGVSPFIEGGVDKGYTNPTVEQYILEDMFITGFVWNETGKLPNSIYDSGSDPTMEGITLKLYNESGKEVVQTNSNALAANEKYKTAADGKYELIAPCDGKYTVEVVKPDDGEDWGLVKKKVGTNANIYSVGNQSTFKTDVIELKLNYAQKKSTLTNINFGLYTMAKLNLEDANTWVHAGDVATASIAFEGNQISIGEKPIARFASASDSSIARVIDNNDNTATITGLKAGKTYTDVRFIDLYGNYITGRANIVTYIRVKYDAKANGGSGEVEDANKYYAASGSNAYKVLGNSNVKPPAGYNFSGWSTKKDSTKDNFDRRVGDTYSIELTDITKDITLFAIYQPKEGIEYRIEYYRQKVGSPSDAAASYEHYVVGDKIATGSTADKVIAPDGYLTEFADDYKFNATLSNAELEKTIEVDSEGNGITVVKLYYDIDYKDISWYDDIEQDPPIKKAIKSKYGKRILSEQEFKFTMTGIDGAPLPPEREGETTYDKETNTLTATLSTKEALTGIEFGNISFGFKDAGKTFNYVIKEVPQDILNYTFDEVATGNGYTMSVEIYVDGLKLAKNVSYGVGENASDTIKVTKATESNATKDGIVITNTYTEGYDDIHWYGDDDIEQDPPIKKAIVPAKSKMPNEEQEFEFTMTGVDGAPLPDARDGETTYDSDSNTLTAKLSTMEALKGIEFGNIAFGYDDVDKTYEYIIREVPQDIKGYTFDEIATGENGYKMTVTISIDEESDKLTKTVTYSGGDGATEDGITITNTYTASSSGGGGGSSSGGETGKHAVNVPDTNSNQNNDNNEIIFVEPKPKDDANNGFNISRYKDMLWDLLPKTGEERAISLMFLSMLALLVIFGTVILKKRNK